MRFNRPFKFFINPALIIALFTGCGVQQGSISKTDSSATTTPSTSSEKAYVAGGNSFAADSKIGLLDNSNLDLVTNGLSRMTIGSSGNIGVGTTTVAPVDLLSIGPVNASSTRASLNLSNTPLVGASASGTYIGANPATASADFVNYQVAGATKFFIDKNGKVGIGTATPTGAFEVQGGSASAANTSGTGINLVAQDGNGNANGGDITLKAGSGNWGNGTIRLDLGTNLPSTVLVKQDYNSSYTSTGSWSGGAAPWATVNTSNGWSTDGNTAGFGLNVRNTATNEQQAYFVAVSVNGGAVFAPALAWGVTTGTAPKTYVERMRLDSSGNLGVGTNLPGGRIDASQGTAGAVALQASSGGSAFWKVLNPAGGIGTAWNAANSVLYVGKDNGTNRSINAAGTINASGADFAEWVDWSGPKPEVGSVIHYRGSYVVVSSSSTAAFIGNDVKDPQSSILVAFMGQLPVLVRGPVQEGDLIVADQDGVAKAIPKDQASVQDAYRAVGTAWSSSEVHGIKRVHVAVGMGLAGGLRDIASLHQKTQQLEIENSKMKLENQKLKEANEQILSRMKSIEKALKLR